MKRDAQISTPLKVITTDSAGNLVDTYDLSLLLGIVSIDLSDLGALITDSELQPTVKYGITDSQMGGTILVEAVSNNKLARSATWLRDTDLRSFGWIRLTGGASGSVDTVTVNGVNVMTASVPFSTNLITTCQNVCANIVANSGVSGWTAVPVTDTIVLIATTPSSATNGLVVNGTATTITLGGIQNTVKGAIPVSMVLDIVYESSLDKIAECYDPYLDNKIRTNPDNINAVKRIKTFRWGDPVYENNFVDDGDFWDNFYITDGCVLSNTITRRGKIVQNLGIANNYLYGNDVTGEYGSIQDNVQMGVFAVGTPQISLNRITGVISGNIFTGNGASMYANVINNNGPGSGIYSNVLSGSSIPQISYNQLLGQGCDINENILAAPRAYINNNLLLARECAIWKNTFNNTGGTEKGIRSNVLSGFQSAISQNIINATGDDCGYQDNILSGRGAKIELNTMTSVTSGLRGGVFGCRFTGVNSGMLSCTTIHDMRGWVLEAENGKFDGIDFSNLARPIYNVHWSPTNIVTYNVTIFGLNGGANAGLEDSPIYITKLPVAKMYPTSVIFEGVNFVGSGAKLQIGIETDDLSSLMPPTDISTLNTIVGPGFSFTKTAAAGRRIIATPTEANITSGDFQLQVEMAISTF